MVPTMSTLIMDVLPRLNKAPQSISIYQAANSVLAMIFKHLVDWDADFLATGNLFIVLPPYDYMAPLPADFLSMTERPLAVSAASWLSSSAWMAGTVASYDPVGKVLVVNVTAANGSGALSSWNINIGVLPGQPVQQVDTSVSAVTVPAVLPAPVTLTTANSDTFVPGQNVIISNVALPTDTSVSCRMDQEFLDSDNENDDYWWLNYYQNGVSYDGDYNPYVFPRWFKIIGSNLYVR